MCHSRRVTADVSQQMCHSRCVTADVSQQTCHSKRVTANVSQQMCHSRRVIANVSQQMFHGKQIVAKVSQQYQTIFIDNFQTKIDMCCGTMISFTAGVSEKINHWFYAQSNLEATCAVAVSTKPMCIALADCLILCFVGGIRGLQATAVIPNGSVIVSIPRSMLITTSSALRDSSIKAALSRYLSHWGTECVREGGEIREYST